MFLEHIQRWTYWIMPLHTFAQVAWYKVFGFSLLAMRELSATFGLIALLALATLAFRLTQTIEAAFLTVLIVGTDYYFLTRAADGRMDAMAAAFCFCGLATYVVFRERSLSRAILIGSTFAAASAFTHPMGGMMSLVGLATLVLFFDRARLKIGHALLPAIPFLLGIVPWLLYVTKDWHAFREQMRSNSVGRAAGFLNPLHALKLEWTNKYLTVFGFSSTAGFSAQNLRIFVLAAYLLALVATIALPALRKRRGYQALVVLTITDMVALTFLDGAKRWYYMVYVTPLLGIVLASVITWAWQERVIRRTFMTAGLAALILLQVSGTVFRGQRDDYDHRYLPAVQFVEASLRKGTPNARIDGPAELGFEMNFPDNLTDDISLGYRSGRTPDLVVLSNPWTSIFLNDMKRTLPDAANRVDKLLSTEYRKVYDKGGYQIFEKAINANALYAASGM